MIKTWNERLTREMPLTTAMQAEIDELRAKLAALEVKLDAANRELDNVKQVEFPKKCEAVANGWRGKVERLEKKLAELESLYAEKCLQDPIDCNLNKLLAMTDEQVTALTRLEGSNPEEVAALARKTMELAIANVKLAAAETSANELRRAVAELIGADPETWPNHGNVPLAIAAYVAVQQAELAALEAKLAALEAQKIPAAIEAALSNCENLAIASGAHEAYRVVGQAFDKLRATIAAGAVEIKP